MLRGNNRSTLVEGIIYLAPDPRIQSGKLAIFWSAVFVWNRFLGQGPENKAKLQKLWVQNLGKELNFTYIQSSSSRNHNTYSKLLLLSSTICDNCLTVSLSLSSRKGPKPGIYTCLKQLCESAMGRAREHQWSYCKLHYTSAEIPSCE